MQAIREPVTFIMLNEQEQPTGQGMNQEEVEDTSVDTSEEENEDSEEENAEPDYKLELERDSRK